MTEIWERQEDEPNKWYQRFRIYLNQGPERMVYSAYQRFMASAGLSWSASTPNSWKLSVEKYHWKDRAEAFDLHQARLQDAIIAKEKEEVFNTGLAQIHRRVASLTRLGSKIEDLLEQELQKGKISSRSHEVYLSYLDAIAQEKTERVKRREENIIFDDVTSNLLNLDMTKLTDSEMETLQKVAQEMKAREK